MVSNAPKSKLDELFRQPDPNLRPSFLEDRWRLQAAAANKVKAVVNLPESDAEWARPNVEQY